MMAKALSWAELLRSNRLGAEAFLDRFPDADQTREVLLKLSMELRLLMYPGNLRRHRVFAKSRKLGGEKTWTVCPAVVQKRREGERRSSHTVTPRRLKRYFAGSSTRSC